MNMSLNSLRLLALAAALATGLAACGGGSSDNADDRLGTAGPVARFVHAVPGAPAVTLARNGASEPYPTNDGYKYGSQYSGISTGANAFVLSTGAGDTRLALAAVDGNRGHKYTLVAQADGAGVGLLTIDDPYNKSLTSDNARVRLVNASANAQNLDIYLTSPGVDLNTIAPTFAALGYKTALPASGADSREFEGGNTYQLRITQAGAKVPVFNASLLLPKNADWLLLTLPTTALSLLVTNDIRVLLVRSDETARATDEFVSE